MANIAPLLNKDCQWLVRIPINIQKVSFFRKRLSKCEGFQMPEHNF